MTRSVIYSDPGCPGHTDPKSRNGHYITAASEFGAMLLMKQKFPDDVSRAKCMGIDPFTCQLWRENVAFFRKNCC